MSKDPITIKDIADAMGVSISTVSRALKDNPDISESRRKAIQEYAREHRYQPNTLATTLRSSRGARSKLIGVILPQFTHYYFSCILTGIEETCSKHGYQIIVAQSGDSYEREREIIAWRYGLYSGRELTQREIADSLGISRSYVSRIEKKALRKLREEYERLELA